MTTSAELTALAASRQIQPKVQHVVTTFMNNTSRVIWATIKNLTTVGINNFLTVHNVVSSTDMILIPPRGGYCPLLLLGGQ